MKYLTKLATLGTALLTACAPGYQSVKFDLVDPQTQIERLRTDIARSNIYQNGGDIVILHPVGKTALDVLNTALGTNNITTTSLPVTYTRVSKDGTARCTDFGTTRVYGPNGEDLSVDAHNLAANKSGLNCRDFSKITLRVPSGSVDDKVAAAPRD